MSYFQPFLHFLALPGWDTRRFVIHTIQIIRAWPISCVTSSSLFTWLTIQLESRKCSVWGRKSKGRHASGQHCSYSHSVLFSSTRQHPNTACFITPTERKIRARSLCSCLTSETSCDQELQPKGCSTDPLPSWLLVVPKHQTSNLKAQRPKPSSAYSGIISWIIEYWHRTELNVGR